MYYVNVLQNESNKRLKMVSFRASEEEVRRIKELSAELIGRNPYLKEADILRELVGLENTGIITKEMRQKLLPVKPGDELEIIGEGAPNENN